METIRQDFEFDTLSLPYGRFLQTVYEHFPGIKLSDVSIEHEFVGGDIRYIRVDVPVELAVVLKLQFGERIRYPIPPEEPTYDGYQYNKKIKNTYWEDTRFYNNNILKEIYNKKLYNTKDYYFSDL